MREIKFRAWDKLNKEMFNVEIINFQERRVYKDTVSYRKFEDIELIQYTELKDKNNKEIYEGDVVKLVHTGIEISADRLEDLKRFAGIIKYENGIFKIVKTEKSLIESKYFEMEQKKVSEIFIYSKLYDLEVVGNIYENPELLKENNN
ncbi:YopX family protein [Fusobacterium polymorphum]|uniref:YopX family protein n=1 Tax=Fusobacterium nucleatum subsp. polymorphum TaxID=76857 RepID=UPI00300B9A09